MKKNLCLILSCLLIVCSACSADMTTEQSEDFTFNADNSMQTSGLVCENERLCLLWDNDSHCVLLKDKSNDYIWSTTPYEAYTAGNNSYNLASPLVIDYYDPMDGTIQSARAMDAIDNGTVSTRIEHRVLYIDYYFNESKIFLSIYFKLTENSLLVGLNTSDIVEYGDKKLISISLVPYLCSTPNSSDTSNYYIFVPSGSGALMYVDEEPTGVARQYSGEVYGKDPTEKMLDFPAEHTSVRLPVYGVKKSDGALVGIIESGDNAASIQATSGNPRTGFSNVYTSFKVRGINNIEWDTGKVVNGAPVYKDVILFTKSWSKNQEYTVAYYPLSGNDADYNGMANLYRQYLIENKLLKKSKITQAPFNVTFVGGVLINKFVCGVPYKSLLPLTTFSEAKTILNELIENSELIPQVQLYGFGKYGVSSYKIAGGFAFASSLGNRKDQFELESYCLKNGIMIYTDFDLINFSKSGYGISRMFDSALTVDSQKVSQYPLLPNIRVPNTEVSAAYFIKREKIDYVSSKIITFAKDRLSGISLTSLGKTAYSDYSEGKYMLRGQMIEQTRKIIEEFQKTGHPILLSEANSYIAGLSDSIVDVPLHDGAYDGLDVAIPFYEMIYRGYVPIYSIPVNMALDAEEIMLSAVESGVSPSFILINSYDILLVDYSDTMDFYGLDYRNNKDFVVETVKKIATYINEIKNAKIVSHHILSNKLTKTVFDNGGCVVVNRSDTSVTYNGVELEAKSFQYFK